MSVIDAEAHAANWRVASTTVLLIMVLTMNATSFITQYTNVFIHASRYVAPEKQMYLVAAVSSVSI